VQKRWSDRALDHDVDRAVGIASAYPSHANIKTSIKTGVDALNGTLKGGMHTDTITQKFCFM
jgi:hypothetical protein